MYVLKFLLYNNIYNNIYNIIFFIIIFIIFLLYNKNTFIKITLLRGTAGKWNDEYIYNMIKYNLRIKRIQNFIYATRNDCSTAWTKLTIQNPWSHAIQCRGPLDCVIRHRSNKHEHTTYIPFVVLQQYGWGDTKW